MRVACLTSGGVDSTVVLHMLSRDGPVLPLFVDYGQGAARREERAAAAVCRPLGLQPAVIRVRGLLGGPCGAPGARGAAGRAAGSPAAAAAAAAAGACPAGPYVPKRNMLLLSAAASFARLNSCDAVAIGVIRGAAYGDQTEEFVQRAEAALSADGKIAVVAPLAGMIKAEVGRLAGANGVPLRETYSCEAGSCGHCGGCAGCRDRNIALAAAAA